MSSGRTGRSWPTRPLTPFGVRSRSDTNWGSDRALKKNRHSAGTESDDRFMQVLRPPMIRRLSSPCLIAAAAAVAFTASAVALSPQSSQKPQDPVVVPFELRSQLIWMRCSVNGHEVEGCALDTGAQYSIVDSRLLDEVGLKTSRPATANGVGSTMLNGGMLRPTAITVGTAKFPAQPLAAFPIPSSLSEILGRRLDLIIGASLLNATTVTIDPDKQQLVFFDQFEAPETLPLKVVSMLPYVDVGISVEGLPSVRGSFQVDTGANATVDLHPEFIRTAGLSELLKRPTQTSTAFGASGRTSMTEFRLQEIELGATRFKAPTAAMLEERQLGGPTGDAGVLGWEILRRFKSTFDLRGRRLGLTPSRFYSDPFRVDLSGLVLGVPLPKQTNVSILDVRENSPASAAGLKAGDVVSSVNGERMTPAGLDQLRKALQASEQTFAFVVQRGSQTMTLSLKTRRDL